MRNSAAETTALTISEKMCMSPQIFNKHATNFRLSLTCHCLLQRTFLSKTCRELIVKTVALSGEQRSRADVFWPWQPCMLPTRGVTRLGAALPAYRGDIIGASLHNVTLTAPAAFRSRSTYPRTCRNSSLPTAFANTGLSRPGFSRD